MGCIFHAKLPFVASSASTRKGKGWRNSGFVTEVDGPFRKTGTQILLQQDKAWSQLGAISLVTGGAGEHVNQPSYARRP